MDRNSQNITAAGNSSALTMFEKRLRNTAYAIKDKAVHTKKHNGKVERSHRKDNEYFMQAIGFTALRTLQSN